MFSNNLAYLLTIAAKKPSVYVMHMGYNSKIILNQQRVENNTEFAYFKYHFGLWIPYLFQQAAINYN